MRLRWHELVWVMFLAFGGMPGRAVEGVFKVETGAGSVRPELEGVQLGVMSMEVKERQVKVRLGYRNARTSPFEGTLAAPTGPIRLEAARLGSVMEAVEVDQSLIDPVFERGLRPGTLRMGTVCFELEEGDRGTWLDGALTLTVPPFSPISLRLENERRFQPLDLRGMRKQLARDLVMKPVVEAVAAFPLRIESVQVVDELVTFEVVAKNASRFPLTWSGKLGLRDMRLLTDESELLEPVGVEGALADRLAPKGGVWAPGQERRGRADFPLPHPHAAATLSFLMPGYEPLACVYDAEEGGWLVVKRAVTEEGLAATAGVEKFHDEERRFESVKAFWETLGQRLQHRDQAGFLQGFARETGAREAQARSLSGMMRVPISWADFHVPPLQKMEGDALTVTGLLVELRYLLAGLPRDNEFVTQFRCDLSRDSDTAPWRVKRVQVEGREPFWQRGFTEVLATAHFLVFYQGAVADGAKRARTAGDQLEKAWSRLQKTPVAPGSRYAAFVIPDQLDFKALTGRDPGFFSGATSAAYGMRKGKLQVVNQAMYVNDSHFSALQRSWGKPDRLVTMQHELVHLALAPQTRPWTPAWLVEGVATHYAGQVDSFSRDGLRRRLPSGRVLAHLSSKAFIGAGVKDADEVWVQYHYSAAAVRWIEQKWGASKLLELYGAFAGVQPKVWENAPLGVFGEERPVESELMKRSRLEMTEQIVKRTLDGWELDQVDTAVQTELRR